MLSIHRRIYKKIKYEKYKEKSTIIGEWTEFSELVELTRKEVLSFPITPQLVSNFTPSLPNSYKSGLFKIGPCNGIFIGNDFFFTFSFSGTRNVVAVIPYLDCFALDVNECWYHW